MDQRRHVQLDELLIERVPEAIAQARRGQGVALGGIGIEDAADEAKLPDAALQLLDAVGRARSEEHTSELQSLMRISYAVFCLKKNKHTNIAKITTKQPKTQT